MEVVYSFDCPVIDIPLGGGIQAGKIIEIRGPESVGKSTISIQSAFNFFDYWVQKKIKLDDLEVLWIETESAFDLTRASHMRPDLVPYINRVEITTVEEVADEINYYLDKLEESDLPGFIVWDTLAAIQTKAQHETSDPYGGGQMEVPRRLRALMRDIVTPLGKTKTTLILSNQLYHGSKDNPNNRFEKPKPQSYGGGAVKYYSSVRLDLKRGKDIIQTLSDGSEICTGISTKCSTIKNKLIRPRISFEIHINNEKGLDSFNTTYDFMKENKIFNVKGGWKTFEILKKPVKKTEEAEYETLKFQSADKLKDLIEKDPHIKKWVDYKIYNYYANTTPLTKIKLIHKIWEIEQALFGKKETILSNEEMVAAKAEEKAIEMQAKRDEERLKRKKPKKK
jgi:RecA/RadA recombinase